MDQLDDMSRQELLKMLRKATKGQLVAVIELLIDTVPQELVKLLNNREGD